jgi:NADH-quinone oxidoreductase subunit N
MKEILISSLLGLVVLIADILKLRKIVFAVVLLGLAALAGSCIMDWGHNEIPFAEKGKMLIFDNFALAFTFVISVVSFLWFFMTKESFSNNSTRSDLYALAAFSICGAVIMVSYSNLVMLFLGVEILSIPVYVLAASDKKSFVSNEAGFKYFFLGAVASAFLLFGIALVYGACGSFDLAAITQKITAGGAMPSLFVVGSMLILAGFAFKISVAPFHMWAPDVYQGSPTVVTAFMATIVKAAAFGGMFRLFSTTLAGMLSEYALVFALMTGLTLIVANVIATRQTNSKRLLAYSSVSHAGFMLGAVMMASSMHYKYLLYYVFTYSIASLTAFTALNHVSVFQGGDESTDAFKGLVRRNPIMAGAVTVSLLSMAGIPPLSGFMAKYFVISNVLNGGHIWLVIIMILTSVIAMYYYLKLIIAMFTPLENAGRIAVGGAEKMIYVLMTVLLVALFFGAGALEMVKW